MRTPSSSLVGSGHGDPARAYETETYVSRSRIDASPAEEVLLSHLSSRSIKINEDNNKDTAAKGLSCKFFLIPFAVDAHPAPFQVEADPAETISNLKEKINVDQGHPVESQKIIYSGNIAFITQTT